MLTRILRPHLTVLLSAISIACMTGCPASESDEHANAAADPSSVSEPAAADTRPNAAREYARLDSVAGTNLLDPFEEFDPGDPLMKEQAAYLVSKQEIINGIINASSIERCDFAIDPNAGIELKIPELAGMRRFVRILNYDAQRSLKSVNGQREASDRLIAMSRISSHCGETPILVAKLVGIACLDLTTEAIERLGKNTTPEIDRERVLAELHRVKKTKMLDPFPALDREIEVLKALIRRGGTTTGVDASEVAPARREIVISEVDRVYSELRKAWGTDGAEQHFRRVVESSKIEEASPFISWMTVLPKLFSRTQQGLDRAITFMSRS